MTTSLVVAEAYTFMRARLGAKPSLEFVTAIRSSPRTQRVLATEEWEIAAEGLLAQYADQDFSYVDAVSFVVMRNLGIREAFAFDHHFVIAGFALFGDAS